MKAKYLFISAILPLAASAQKLSNDTIKTKQLEEIVVEAKMQKTGPGSTIYYPDKNSKRTAQNAVDLIDKMGIPQISVNSAAGTIETPAGENVAIYIDMEPATEEEKQGLRAEDVKKVEYLVFPSDPRYNNNKYVINITLRRADFGGYVKLQGNANIMAGSGNGLAYVKLAHKKMTYDINISDKYIDRGHTGNELTQVFRFPQENGSINEITRTNLLDNSKFKQNTTGLSFRARYSGEKVSISNSVYVTAKITPHSDYTGSLSFSDTRFKEGTYSNSYNSKYLYPRWQGYWYFDLGNGFKLNTIPSVFYQHTSSNRLYKTDETSITTDAEENAITGQLQMQLAKTIHKYHSIDVNLLGVYYYNKVNYFGNTTASPVFNQFAYGGAIGYRYAKEKFLTRAMLGFAGESNKISGVRTNSFIPIVNATAQYAINDKHSLGVDMSYHVNTVDAADKTPDIIQENELLYKIGNLHLKNTHWWQANIEYTWLPNNKFSISAFSGWKRFINRPIPVFTPDGPNGTMLRSIENNGDYQDIYLGCSLTARLLNRKLVLKVKPQAWFEQSTGIYADHSNYVSINLSATYYIGKFYVSASFSNANRMLLQYSLTAMESKGKNYYSIKAGWSNGKWNISASAINIFRKGWESTASSLKSKWFDQYSQEFGASDHQFVNITASYTFGFGKKVKRGDEIGSDSTGKSAIVQ